MLQMTSPITKLVQLSILCLLMIAVPRPTFADESVSPADAKSLVEAFFNARESLVSGRLVIRGTRTYPDGAVEETIDIAFDERGGKIRHKYDQRELHSTYIRNATESSLYLPKSHLVMRDVPDRAFNVTEAMPVDIRTVGLISFPGFSARTRLEEIASVWRAQTIHSMEKDDAGRYRVEWTNQMSYPSLQSRRRIWLDPNEGFSIVRFEMWVDVLDKIGKVAKSELVNEQTTSNAKIGSTWVPVRWITKSHRNKMEFDWRIEWKSVNEAIPESEFSLAELNVPDGTLIEDYRFGKLVRTRSNRLQSGEP